MNYTSIASFRHTSLVVSYFQDLLVAFLGRQFFPIRFIHPRQPRGHPKVVRHHSPRHLEFAVFEAFGQRGSPQKDILENPDPSFGLPPAFEGRREDFVAFHAVRKLLRPPRTPPVERFIGLQPGYFIPRWQCSQYFLITD